jgi:hypothetical protein
MPAALGPSLVVSVLLPVRDGERHLADCIDSLGAQTFRDFEVIAVDDGSSDATPELLRDWSARDRRVRLLRQQALGLVAALERGRTSASGRYLARMDADDVAAPDRLERQLALLEARPELAGCGCGIHYFPEALVKDGARRYQRWINALLEPDEIARDLFVECPIAHPTFFLRADAVAAVGGYRNLGWPEDYDLLIRLWEAGARFAKVPAVLVRWRERPDRLSRVHPSYGPEAFRRLKVEALTRTLLRGRDGVIVWGAGPTGKAFARTLLDHSVKLRAFVDLDPRKVGQTIHGAPVISVDDVNRFRDAFCVAAVGQPGARAQIRASLIGLGWQESADFVAVA